MDTSERDFEDRIEASLLAHGYEKRDSAAHYDKALCLDPDLLVGFVQATQPKTWQNLREQHGADPYHAFVTRVAGEIQRHGAVRVLREGIKDRGQQFHLAYFRPETTLNPDAQALHAANRFSVVRQLAYSESEPARSLDLALFLNGIPLFTAELKNPFKKQDLDDAIHQYRHRRDPREPLFQRGRCLAHFAVDTQRAAMTPELAGPSTRFFPFDQGFEHGAGNPPRVGAFPTAFLWEDVWSKDSVLELVQHFVHELEEQHTDDKGRKRRKKVQIFPRYHQRDTVRRLVAHARAHGAGPRYLIQHSAGSGKSNTIAWLAHRLCDLHDDRDERVFHSVIVITDRRVLDRQLGKTVRAFQHDPGIVEHIDRGGRHLREALEAGKKIIVSTLQKFPVIAEEVRELCDKRFAVIVDEAHSSQTGESRKALNQTLTAGSLDEAAAQDSRPDDDTIEDRIVREMEARGPAPNVSTFAFTATPKQKTLELFGTKRPDGRFEPFSLYSMRQAIQERFILDVLERYTTLQSWWKLKKTIEEDPAYETAKAKRELRAFVAGHEHTIREKAKVVVDHFEESVRDRIPARKPGRRRGTTVPGKGRAKAMVVTSSRLHAVRWYDALRAELRERGLPHGVMVAFSGSVVDQEKGGSAVTEAGLNGCSETQTAARFHDDANRFLVVAEKFQTGFDEPLLYAMYVDKKLAGVNAVQTLSRLNRTHPDKDGCVVLDFANDAGDIQEAFQPYYERTLLSEATDPNQLYTLQRELLDAGIHGEGDVKRVSDLVFEGRPQEAVLPLLSPLVERFDDEDVDLRRAYRKQLGEFGRLYAFLSQIVTFRDPELERLHVFGRLLLPLLKIPDEPLPAELLDQVDLDSYRLDRTHDGKIELERGAQELEPVSGPGTRADGTVERIDPLSEILEELNQRFGLELGDEDRVILDRTLRDLDLDAAVEASVRVNTEDNARLTFEQKLGEMFERILEKNIALYNRLTKDPDVGAQLRDGLFRSYVDRRRELLELIDGGEGKRVEFKESLRGGPDAVAEVRKGLQHASLKTIAAFLNTDGGDLLLGVRDDGEVGGIEVDGFESPDKFQLHLMNLVGEALGAPAGTLVDPEPRRLADKTVCRVNCGASPWPVRLKWKGTESSAEGDLFVRTGPQTTRLEGDEVADYIRARWPDLGLETTRADTADAAPPWRPELVVPYTEERFTICVPLIALEAVAGSWSDTQTLDNAVLEQAEDWVRLPEGTRAGPGCFVAQVRGRSMEPKIRDGAWCLFEAPVRGGTRKGRILLVQMRDATDPETGARCTVKVFERKGSPPVVTLSPINREFEPIVATKDAAEAVRPVAEWRAVLDG